MTVPGYTLSSLPSPAQEHILKSHHLRDQAAHRRAVQGQRLLTGLGRQGEPAHEVSASELVSRPVIWATEGDHVFSEPITAAEVALIRPRVDKSKEEQRRRVKDKAEVFTPSWVCNLQNNLIDEAVLGKDAFNRVESPAAKTWIPTEGPVVFNAPYTWAHYVTENRLEMTCGEGPYLFSRYDTVTGDPIPVRENGLWHRIGLLDRKLRVVSENTGTEQEWTEASMYALRSTFGYEWQGDNLLLARLNFFNTYVDYYRELWGKNPSDRVLAEVAEIASWNLWQMDGLKMVVPGTCSPACQACAEKKRGGHDGVVSLVRMGGRVKTFEELLPEAMFPARQAPKAKPTSTKKTPVSKPSAPAVSLFG